MRLPQPWRGLVLSLLGGGLALLMLEIYQRVALGLFALPSGGPGYFQFWPLRPAVKADS